MAVVAPRAGAGLSREATLVALLAAAIFINYVDRGNLATAAPLMKGELGLTNAQFGLLTSAFFWIYAPAQLLVAGTVRRFDAYRALAAGLALWSVATMASGLAQGLGVLLALRVVLGLGESVGFPAAASLLVRHLPSHRLGSANALISSGISLGPAVGTFVGGMVVAGAGWRALFLVFGAASLVWLVPWLAFARGDREAAASARMAPEPGYRELLSRRELWGASLGHFASNYAFYLVLSWLPLYLVKAHGYSVAAMAQLGGAVYAGSAVIGLICGGLADRWMAAGATATRVRRPMLAAGFVIGLLGMLACAQGDGRLAVAGLATYALCHGLVSFNTFASGQTLAGPAAAAKWIGVQNFFANLAGIVAPIVTGALIDRTGDFRAAFLVAAAVLVLGLAGWTVLIRRVEPLGWTAAA